MFCPILKFQGCKPLLGKYKGHENGTIKSPLISENITHFWILFSQS